MSQTAIPATMPETFYAMPKDGKLQMDEPGRWAGYLAKHQGKRLKVTVERPGNKRSLSQNAYFHGVIVPAVAEYSGCTNAEAKDGLKGLFLSKTIVLPSGEELETVQETAKLTLEEFTTFLDHCHAWCGQSGIVLEKWEAA